MSDWTYKVVALPRTLAVMKSAFRDFKDKDRANTVAAFLQNTIAESSRDGWEFYRIDTVNLFESAGCLGSLFGQSDKTTAFNVVTFRKAAVTTVAPPPGI